MSVDPTTTEGRVAIGTWAKLGHDIPGHKVLALLDALDEAEAAATRSNDHANDVEDRVLGLVERAENAEDALDRVRAVVTDYEHFDKPIPHTAVRHIIGGAR